MDFIKELLHYLNPEVIIQIAEQYQFVLPMVALIIFAETGLLFGFFLPGDSLLFITGLFAATTDVVGVGIVPMLAILCAAAIIGDQVGYMIGRKVGPALFRWPESRFFKPQYVERAHAFYVKHGGKAIVIGRFAPILRTFVPTVAGVAYLDYKKFVFFNITGGILWICSMTLLGYLPPKLLGEAFTEQYIQPNVQYIALGIIFLSLIPVFIAVVQERVLNKQKEKEANTEA